MATGDQTLINFPREETLQSLVNVHYDHYAKEADTLYKAKVAAVTSKTEVDGLFVEWWKYQYNPEYYSKVDMMERWFGNVLEDDRVHGEKQPLYSKRNRLVYAVVCYADDFTIYGDLSKLKKAMKKATSWAEDRLGLKIKNIWQFYPVTSLEKERKNQKEEVQRGIDMGNVAKIVVGVLAIGGTFFILLIREFGKFIDEVSPYNYEDVYQKVTNTCHTEE